MTTTLAVSVDWHDILDADGSPYYTLHCYTCPVALAIDRALFAAHQRHIISSVCDQKILILDARTDAIVCEIDTPRSVARFVSMYDFEQYAALGNGMRFDIQIPEEVLI